MLAIKIFCYGFGLFTYLEIRGYMTVVQLAICFIWKKISIYYYNLNLQITYHLLSQTGSYL